ncbi:MAG: hypothetical protein IIW48_06145 [Clostridia bacterium]|nr:hypothetical protein [Clostridia bacterium]
MNSIIAQRVAALLEQGRAVVAIDGNCASGKTTLADEIQRAFGGTVIRADSFFLPFDMRSEERLSEPGGNFHYERFASEVIANIKSSAPFTYGVFDCSRGRVTHSISVDEPRLVIIEGSYCMHPKLEAYYDLRIFCRTDERTQLERIKKRNGEEALAAFKQKWIPLENAYFDFFGIADTCHIISIT